MLYKDLIKLKRPTNCVWPLAQSSYSEGNSISSPLLKWGLLQTITLFSKMGTDHVGDKQLIEKKCLLVMKSAVNAATKTYVMGYIIII